jgi:DNA-binding MarR family transcriptional regulator
MQALFQLDQFLPYRISCTAECVSQSLAGVYARRFRISVPQWRILATLSAQPDLSATMVASHCNLGKVKVSRALAGLEQRKLLSRRVRDSDARSSTLRLTAKGASLFAEIAPLARSWEAELLSSLSPEDRETLFSLLSRLDGALESIHKAGDDPRQPER